MGLPPAPTGFMGFLLHKRRWDPKVYDQMGLKVVSPVMNIMDFHPSCSSETLALHKLVVGICDVKNNNNKKAW